MAGERMTHELSKEDVALRAAVRRVQDCLRGAAPWGGRADDIGLIVNALVQGRHPIVDPPHDQVVGRGILPLERDDG